MPVLIQYKNGVAGIRISLDNPVLHVGRSEQCEICLDDELASREHAIIERVTGVESGAHHFMLRDLASTNGTFVNHDRVSMHLLIEGDIVRIGQTFFKYSDAHHPELAETRVIRKTLIPGLFYTTEKETK